MATKPCRGLLLSFGFLHVTEALARLLRCRCLNAEQLWHARLTALLAFCHANHVDSSDLSVLCCPMLG